jgi:subtilisin family serine protease
VPDPARARRSRPAVTLLLFLLLLAMLPSLPAGAAGDPPLPPTLTLPDPTLKHERLDSPLLRAAESQEVVGAAPEAHAREATRTVAISVRVSGDPAATAMALDALGASIANIGEAVVEARAPVGSLEAIAAMPGVLSVREVERPIARAVLSQGVALHGVPAWSASGYSGAGVRVGVIDVGFEGYRSLIGSEVPQAVGRCYVAVGVFTGNLADCESGGRHGTAVAETVVDVAPGATLYIANPQSPRDLHDTVRWMAEQGVTIINHSVGWGYEGPGDGTTLRPDGPLAAVDRAVAGGITWVNAAGNEGLSSWSGSYADANGNRLLEFAPQVEMNPVAVSAGQELSLYLRWADSWSAAAIDLDLYLVDAAGNILARSEMQQSGVSGHEPFERLRYRPAATGTVYAAIRHYAGGQPAWVQMQALSGEVLKYGAASYSMGNPAESRNSGLLAVGAASWQTPQTIEPFSSQGPTRDGRIKPDVVGIDRADTVSYGPASFAGTSQAAPHVAGLAALVKQRFPHFSAADVAAYLRANASRATTPDMVWGYGLALLPADSGWVPPPDDAPFAGTWSRTDRPVKDLAVSRTWMWGDGPSASALWEEYADAPDGRRAVQYFDKSRMEVTHPDGDATSPWYVTNGLLVVELVTGNLQLGDDLFEERAPAEVNVAGDPDVLLGPTYATFGALRAVPALPDGAVVIQRLTRDGTVTDDPGLSGYGVTAAYRVTVPEIDHQVASPFWAFMNATGLVHEGGRNVEAPLFLNPFYATGYPITEAYWTTVMVGGIPRDVLVQCFERRCLTYTPDNPPGWQVEAGNVGRHYYIWRYGQDP